MMTSLGSLNGPLNSEFTARTRNTTLEKMSIDYYKTEIMKAMYVYNYNSNLISKNMHIQGDHKKLLQTAVQTNKVRMNFFDIFKRILLV